MTDNELIAEWLGAKEFHKEMVVGDIVLSPDSGKFFAIGYVTEIRGHKLHTYRPWSPLTDITLWHGDDGLMAEIERQEKALDFMFELQVILDVVPQDGLTHGEVALLYWPIRRAEPAQLTAALIKMLENDKRGEK